MGGSSSGIEEKKRGVDLSSSSSSSSSSATHRSSAALRILLVPITLTAAAAAIMYFLCGNTNPSSLILIGLAFPLSKASFSPSPSSSHAANAKVNSNSPGLPMVINTWGGPFTAATDSAYLSLLKGNSTSALDAVEIGCSTCEENQCDGTVGYGGSPDENCETTLDALIIDGTTLNSGAVASLRNIRNAISVARAVLAHTTHSMLAGDLATQFAVSNGFPIQNLTTEESLAACQEWKSKENDCQPNYRVDVTPDPSLSCGPYTPLPLSQQRRQLRKKSKPVGHDTISMITLRADNGTTGINGISMAAGTSTNGASYKVPGRVGDGPIMGSGSYVDGEWGGCGATGDGDLMMRFLPCYQAVENLRLGMSPQEAAEDVVRRMLKRGGDPGLQSGVVVVDREGRHGGAGSGWTFVYSVRGGDMAETEVFEVEPLVSG